MTRLTSTLSLLCLAMLAGCASSADTKDEPKGAAAFKDDARLGAEVKKICFNRSIDGFSNARKDTVVLSRGVSDDYLVQVRGVCSNLRYAQSIAIDSSLSCVSRGDYLIVSDSAFALNDGTGLGPDRCLIGQIYKWDKTAKAPDKE